MTTPQTGSRRFDAIDALRGLVIALMTIDHASGAFNAGRFMQDAASFWKPGSELPADQFVLRWITHLCAPTFVFLAGTSIALSASARAARGQTERSIDVALLKRGAFIALVDPLWMSLAFLGYTGMIFQVMYALGVSMMMMAALRKLPTRVLLGGALAFSVLSELLVDAAVQATGGKPSVVAALLLSGGFFPMSLGPMQKWIIAYPVLPWLTLMVFGYVFGHWLLRGPAAAALTRRLVLVGGALLVTFLAIRGMNAYGNMHLHREAPSLLHWLHVSKYPPSLTYVTLELGIAALVLALFTTRALGPGSTSPWVVLGRTSLFFYLLHAHVLAGAAALLDMLHKAGIGAALLAAVVTLVLLYPLCIRYARYKAAHPDGFARYV